MALVLSLHALKCRFVQCAVLKEIRRESMISEFRNLFAEDFSEHNEAAKQQADVRNGK